MNMQVDRLMRMLGKNRNSPITAWIGFLFLSLLVWKLVSDGDFSFIMTYGAFARTFGFGLLAFKVNEEIWAEERTDYVWEEHFAHVLISIPFFI